MSDNKNNKLNHIFPVMSYISPYENRADIYKDNNNKSRIYRWINLINGKCYIGSGGNLRNRFFQYLSISNITNALLKYNSNVYKALLKYKYSNFRL